ncbi:hypothetical protein [Dactylosporangium darangshiense]|uniref:Uncharacterized protein n=1 Tax=Dactylosporangium darangshiense TaxID=579108 RepID=A0ABP8DKA3_9ACTN
MTNRVNINAQDNAKVGSMVGVVHGDATFYNIGERSSPSDRFRVGLNYLEGNVPRKAEELIHEAIRHGFRGARVAYYWAIALLSGRSFDHLDDADFDKLNEAIAIAHSDEHRGDGEGWRLALDVVMQMLQCLALHDVDADDEVPLDEVMDRYEALPDARRDEIRRHLQMIMVGSIQDLIDELDAEQIRRLRLAGNRDERAAQFFLPPQASAVLRPLILPDETGSDAGSALFGLVLASFGALGSLYLAFEADVLAALGVAALWGAATFCVVRFGRDYIRLRARRDRKRPWWEERRGLVVSPELGTLIAARFARHRPDGIDEETWVRETSHLRSSIGGALVAQYSGVWQRDAGFAPYDIFWLVDWHAMEAARRWTATRTVARPEPPRPTIAFATGAGYFGGIALFPAGVVVALFSLSGWSILLGLLASTAVVWGLGLVGIHAPVVFGRRALIETDEDERQRQLEEEEKAFQRWEEHLANRPTDAEMARWLDYDKAYVKDLAMRQFGLRNRDLIGHVILTQADDVCMRARVLYGPPRYSAYQVRLFLLTARGIREVNVHLDFLSGVVFNEHRNVFQYSSITSAEVGEVSIRLNDGRREVERVGARTQRAGEQKLTFAHALHLTLNNGRTTFVLIENFDQGLLDRVRENAAYLEELARDAAGVTGALRILEAIAAEGAAWVDEERKRRNRRLRNYRDRQRRRARELGAAPTLDLGQLPRQPHAPHDSTVQDATGGGTA